MSYKLQTSRGALGLSYFDTIFLLQLYFSLSEDLWASGLPKLRVLWASHPLYITRVLYSACLLGIPMSVAPEILLES